jgi:hypothetical protein
MPSNRNDEAQDPVEDDDLIGAGEDDDEAEDEDEDEDDDILDEEDDEEEDEEDEENEDLEEEEGDDERTASAREDVTREVGSEGGSPGEAVERTSRRAGLGRGSEATQTWEGGRDATYDRRDDDGRLVKRVS